MTEEEPHESFAEAILAGHPSSHRNPEIIVGLATADPVEEPDIIWYQNPKAWNLIHYAVRRNKGNGYWRSFEAAT